MFGLKKKKTTKFEVVAPINGECIPLDKVPDQVFSTKMMGDGFAVIPEENAHQVVAPITGTVVALPDSKHAVGIAADIQGIQVLVHIGLDTVKLQGTGFTPQVKIDQKITAGTPIVAFDPKVMQDAGLNMTTMVIFTDGYKESIDIGSKAMTQVTAGQAILKQA
ncbi:pts, eiia [Lapidilactobacillus dextrinicus DSM 20335]|uniref:Pts, eiia n=1 Tax=Lapidilactobacillus dextrinicus DSM 20335 TaxID=1423738 RepID=A0A0R2BH63_9LACO|nr:PTS glucose transporter subunit IIA [Lapidilactobacillus dextrinicus]KRM78895.1 pts, eiia [Lapidilactobacillus dextrinicus DSM 20335]QFG47528.1 PTS glucose transporter subunit IIA [Lapidilactobacillus dextrinicus]